MNALDAELSAIAELGLWVCLGWLTAGFVIAALGEIPGVLGATCARLATVVSPPLIRRLAHGGTGLVLSVAGLLAPAGPAIAVGSATPAGLATPTGLAAGARLAAAAEPAAAASSAAAITAGGGPLPSDTVTPRTPGRPPELADWPDLDRPTGPAPRSPITAEPVRSAGEQIERAPDPAGLFATEVVVASGDTLWEIAARELGDEPSNATIAGRWPRWYAENRAVIGPNPHLILPGQRLAPPG